ncbi:flagellar basal-body rod protein FlgF [Ancylobacter dichloromethanicus]|uniref:Flagellar basal-body rod protein FlgF n=1 Tax=Ancylobacter dichloromethanicus TaxID=518825 RepID=A0A9W6MXN7_9HYPH|nr:flagellar basal-body rod protein FlgF [Ancylobacter dichloromethanicus]MBS7556314.1 flagellar basal-body rod protein FlgF [Ancylobacter dichloromethanicus]GLK70077.1 flagellar basal-body rod protein FlgF [Ancylobacter dichloromethanicus]
MAGPYVAISAQMATERRLATIANNIANMNTPGFRAEAIRFEAVLSSAGAQDAHFASAGESYTSLAAGAAIHTGNPLDVAPQGDVWFGVAGPNGAAYTRDGRLHMDAAGTLLTVDNLPVLDAGGTPITLDPAAGAINIGADGAISQGTTRVGTLGLFTLPAGATVARDGGGRVMPDRPAQPVQDFARLGVRQGYIEGSNVDPVLEMTRLITVQRTFEMAAQAVQQNEDSVSEAIRTLGPS